jgi:hypothetical protein
MRSQGNSFSPSWQGARRPDLASTDKIVNPDAVLVSDAACFFNDHTLFVADG